MLLVMPFYFIFTIPLYIAYTVFIVFDNLDNETCLGHQVRLSCKFLEDGKLLLSNEVWIRNWNFIHHHWTSQLSVVEWIGLERGKHFLLRGIKQTTHWEGVNLQCRHLIPALNVWAAVRAKYTTACPIATHFPGHGCMNDPQLNVTLIHTLRGSLMCLSYLNWNVIHGCLYNQAMAGVRSTGAGIKWLYCTSTNFRLRSSTTGLGDLSKPITIQYLQVRYNKDQLHSFLIFSCILTFTISLNGFDYIIFVKI